jgi:hypothetical protein
MTWQLAVTAPLSGMGASKGETLVMLVQVGGWDVTFEVYERHGSMEGEAH